MNSLGFTTYTTTTAGFYESLPNYVEDSISPPISHAHSLTYVQLKFNHCHASPAESSVSKMLC